MTTNFLWTQFKHSFNNCYGDRSKTDSGRIALSEAWAEYQGDSFGAQYYETTYYFPGMSISLIKKVMMTTAGTALLLSLSGCPFEQVSPYGQHDYEFKLILEVSPKKDTLKVGDTLWIEINFQDTMTDLKSNSTINYTNGQFLTPFIPRKIKKGTLQPDQEFDYALNSFHYFSSVGSHVLFDEITVRLTPAYKDKTYKSIFAIIPSEVGLFFLDAPNDESAKVQVSGKTKKVMTIQNFNVPDVKDYLLGSDYPVLRNEYIQPKIKEYGNCVYFFYVKEK